MTKHATVTVRDTGFATWMARQDAFTVLWQSGMVQFGFASKSNNLRALSNAPGVTEPVQAPDAFAPRRDPDRGQEFP